MCILIMRDAKKQKDTIHRKIRIILNIIGSIVMFIFIVKAFITSQKELNYRKRQYIDPNVMKIEGKVDFFVPDPKTAVL